jgi:hypothetical protein
LATSDKATIVIERLTDGKMRVASGSWDGQEVFLRNQVMDVRNADGRPHSASEIRYHDEWGSTDRTPLQVKLPVSNRLHLDKRLQAAIDYILPTPAAA